VPLLAQLKSHIHQMEKQQLLKGNGWSGAVEAQDLKQLMANWF